MSGVGVPNVHVFFFYDQQPIGDLVIGSDGTWTFEVEKKLGKASTPSAPTPTTRRPVWWQGARSLRLGREPKAEGAETAAQEPPPPQPESARAPEAAPPSLPLPKRDSRQANPSRSIRMACRRRRLRLRRRLPVAAAEPQDLSSQPQPVYPEGEAASRLRLEPSRQPPRRSLDLSSQPQPVHPEERRHEPRTGAGSAGGDPAEPSAPVVAERPSEAETARAGKGAGRVQERRLPGYRRRVRKGLRFPAPASPARASSSISTRRRSAR